MLFTVILEGSCWYDGDGLCLDRDIGYMKYTVFKMAELSIKYTCIFICRFLHLEKSLWVIEFLIGQKSLHSWHIRRYMTIGLMNTDYVSGGFIWSRDSFSLEESMLLLRFKILHPCLLFYNIVFLTIIFFNSCLHRSLLILMKEKLLQL